MLKRDNTIEVTTKKLIIKAEDEVTIETKQATIKARRRPRSRRPTSC